MHFARPLLSFFAATLRRFERWLSPMLPGLRREARWSVAVSPTYSLGLLERLAL